MSIGINQNIIGFEISMNVVQLMHSVQCNQNLGDVKTGLILREDVLLHEKIHEVATGKVLHHQVEIAIVLEGASKIDYPGIVFTVGENVFLLPCLNHLVFVDH